MREFYLIFKTIVNHIINLFWSVTNIIITIIEFRPSKLPIPTLEERTGLSGPVVSLRAL